jgi:DNA-binding XRE family transcriptional regulator
MAMAPPRKTPRSNALYVYRTTKKWTQTEMAKEIGVVLSTYQRLETLPLTGRYAKYLLVLEAIKKRHGD